MLIERKFNDDKKLFCLQERSGSFVFFILNRMKIKEVLFIYNRNNKFTQGFQNIIDVYGIFIYQEVNLGERI